MSRERRSHHPEALQLYRPRRIACRSRITWHVECRRFSKSSGRERRGGPERRSGVVRVAPLSAGQLALVTSVACFVFFTRNVSSLTCNCKGNKACNPINRSCPNGCAPGWFGAGCQVGNMAYLKNTSQSSTNEQLSASDRAVDGFPTPAKSSQTNITLSPWWCVNLSQDEDIVITNVTIVAAYVAENRPKEMLILYTRDSGDSPPHPSNWTLFAYQNSMSISRMTIESPKDKLTIGRRVAIYLNGTEQSFLKLFEVYVYGFPFSVSPTIANATWALNETCNTISATATSLTILNLWPSAVLLFGNTTEGMEIERKMEISTNTSGFTFVVFATSDRLYQLWITPEICLSDIIGNSSADSISSDGNCLRGISTAVDVVQTLSRMYEVWTNGSCLLINVRSPPAESCALPILIAGQCGPNSSSSNFTDDGMAIMCGFKNTTNCKVNVTLSNKITEVNVVKNISREAYTDIRNWSANSTCDYITVRLNDLSLGRELRLISVFVNDSGYVKNTHKFVTNNTLRTMEIPISVAANRSYAVWVSIYLCLTNCRGLNEDANCSFSPEQNCILTAKSNVTAVKTTSRVYEAWTNGSCLLISVRSSPAESCTLPISIAGRCGPDSSSSNFTDDGIAIMCGFQNTTNCEVNVTLSNNITEVNVVRNISRETITYIANWSASSTCDYITVRLNDLSLGRELRLISVFVNDSINVQSTQKFVTNNTLRTMEIPISVAANRSYAVWVSIHLCLTNCRGQNEDANCSFSPEKYCVITGRSNVTAVKTNSRVYEAWTNSSCVLVGARSPSEVSCNLPISLSGRCGQKSLSSKFTDDGIAVLCGFQTTTNCEVNVTLSNNITEVNVVRTTSREPTTYIANWSANSTCDYITVRLNDLSLGSELRLISVFVNDSGKVKSIQNFVTNNTLRTMEFPISVAANRSYAVWVSIHLCLTNCRGPNEDAICSFSPEQNCIITAKSNVTAVNTSSRVYEAWANDSCILVGARSPSEVSCDLPISLSIRCANSVSSFTEGAVAILCGVSRATNCSVNATINANVTEVNVVKKISSDSSTNITSWSAQTTCDYINVTINNINGSGWTTSYTVFVNDNNTIQTQIVNNGAYGVSTAVPVAPNRSYAVWINRQRCFTNCASQLNRSDCSLIQQLNCLTTATSLETIVKTKNRVYEALSNGSCAIIQINTEPLCETVDPSMLQCGQFNSSVNIKLNSTTMFCGLPEDNNSSCSAFTTTADGKMQSNAIASFEAVPPISEILWITKPSCDFITVSLSIANVTKPVYALIRDGEGDFLGSSWTNYTDISIQGINVSIPANPQMKLKLVIAQCVENITCNTADHQQCVIKDSCLTHESTKDVVAIMTEYRNYDTWTNESCVFAKLSSNSSQQCKPPTQLSIVCSNSQDAIATNDSTIASLCNLSPDTAYDCIVTAIISNGLTESRSAKALTQSLRSPTSLTAGEIAGAATGSILAAVLLACLIFIVLRRYNIGHRHTNGVLQSICNGRTTKETGAEAEELTVDEAECANVQSMLLPEFFEYAKNEELICRKFEKHVPSSSLSCDVGRHENNKSKNKFQNIVPYDANRVILNKKNDYINASFIKGYFNERKYIATQGPTLNTIGDFWLMVWQQKVSTIVMLTDFVEHSKIKCEKYFPVDGSDKSVVQVKIRSRKMFDSHVVTVLNIEVSHEHRTVTHYHMQAWKDHSIPDHCAQLVLFYSLIPDLWQQSSSISLPTVVVHCSAGAGRTGTFIAFDWLQHCAKVEKRIDVDRCVKTLREQRMHSVQTKEQYVFLHKALLYGIKTLKFTFDADFLNSYANELSSCAGSMSKIDDEWQVLSECSNFVHLYEAANKPENRCKNRSQDILPIDSKRVILHQEGDSSGDYINAVYCNGCYCDKGFVATQIPLQSTVEDFWKMVHDINASCIVLLHPIPEEEEYARYYPHCGHSMTVGRCIISNDSQDDEYIYKGYTVLDLSVSFASESYKNEADEFKVKVFVLTNWKHDEATPKDTGSMIALMSELGPHCQDASRRPVIVQCRDGATHSGLFVCAANAFHRLIETNQVQVFHSVDLARSSRPEFITSKEQYIFIYRMLLQHCEASAVYVNA